MVRAKLVTLTLSPMCDQQRSWERERGVDWWEPVALLILVCVRKAAESHVAWKHVCLSVWWEMESFSASLISFNLKDKHHITSLNKRTFPFFDLMLDIKCHHAITYATSHFQMNVLFPDISYLFSVGCVNVCVSISKSKSSSVMYKVCIQNSKK